MLHDCASGVFLHIVQIDQCSNHLGAIEYHVDNLLVPTVEHNILVAHRYGDAFQLGDDKYSLENKLLDYLCLDMGDLAVLAILPQLRPVHTPQSDQKFGIFRAEVLVSPHYCWTTVPFLRTIVPPGCARFQISQVTIDNHLSYLLVDNGNMVDGSWVESPA